MLRSQKDNFINLYYYVHFINYLLSVLLFRQHLPSKVRKLIKNVQERKSVQQIYVRLYLRIFLEPFVEVLDNAGKKVYTQNLNL